MTTMKQYLVPAGIVLSLVLSVFVLLSPSKVTEVVRETLGAQPSAIFDGQCSDLNGVKTCYAGKPLTQATTTPCAIKSPAATSTLVAGNVRFRVSTTSAYTIHLAKAATPNATTTSLGTIGAAAGAQGTYLASTTFNGATTIADPAFVFAPNTWFVVGLFGGISQGDSTGAGFVPSGSCNAAFQII